MSVPRKPKPDEVAETARVMRIFDWLLGELVARTDESVNVATLLLVAERIAARTGAV